jgi:hypothetical protein
MRRLLSVLAATTLLAQPALAAVPPRCAAPSDQAMFELAALKSELMVLATSCQRGTEYNAFVNRYRPQLLEVDKNLNAHFKRTHGARGQTETDRFVTDLANAQSTVANTMGGDYCARNGMIFGEVLALSGAADLPAYAAGKNLIPAGLPTCPTATAPAARPAAAARTTTRR